MARLPKKGERDWASTMEHYLRESHAEDGTLLTDSVNPHTGRKNPNLANGEKPGLVQLAGDLGSEANTPTVTGIHGRPIGKASPTHGQVLAWDARLGEWVPTDTPNPLVIKSVLG